MATLADIKAVADKPVVVEVNGLELSLRPPTTTVVDSVLEQMATLAGGGDFKNTLSVMSVVCVSAIKGCVVVDDGELDDETAEKLFAVSGGALGELSKTALAFCGVSLGDNEDDEKK